MCDSNVKSNYWIIHSPQEKCFSNDPLTTYNPYILYLYTILN